MTETPPKESKLSFVQSVWTDDFCLGNRHLQGQSRGGQAASRGEARNRFKVGCDEARFRDLLKAAARNQIKKELVAALKRVIHYVEAMASDDDLKELQKAGLKLAKPRIKKRRSQAYQAEVELAPAGA